MKCYNTPEATRLSKEWGDNEELHGPHDQIENYCCEEGGEALALTTAEREDFEEMNGAALESDVLEDVMFAQLRDYVKELCAFDIYQRLADAIKNETGPSLGFDHVGSDQGGVCARTKRGAWTIKTDGDYWHADYKAKEGRATGILKIDADDSTDVQEVARAFVSMLAL